MLKTKVKASQITNLTDARYFSAWEAAYIGFQLEQGSENYVEPVKMKAMKEWLEGPDFVGEFGSMPNVEQVAYLYKELALDAVQVGTLCEVSTIQQLHDVGIPVLKEIVWNENSSWEAVKEEYTQLQSITKAIVLDFSTNNIDISNQLEALKTICKEHPTLVDANLSDVNTFLDTVTPFGLAVKGGEEEKVGYKSFDEMDDLFEALEIFV